MNGWKNTIKHLKENRLKLIKSISYDQGEIIKNIIQLHVPQGYIDCDPTYSKGNFYKNTGIREPKYKFDIEPQAKDIILANAENLPLENESINCIMFDPPHLATTGRSLKINNESNKTAKRFGVYPTEQKLHQFYVDAMKEFYRILNDKGVLIFKIMDKVSSGKQYMTHIFVYNQAVEIGFYPKDLFILLAKNRIVADWQLRNQKHARKFHSYFWVFEKSNRIIKYL